MAKIRRQHEDFLVASAKWIKSNRQKYCPITAVSNLPNWKKTFKDLRKWHLVRSYKSGEVIIITEYGWSWLAEKRPEMIGRHRGETPL